MNKEKVASKKSVLIIVFTCIHLISIAQFFHKSANSKEIQNLRERGLTYILTGIGGLDSAVESSLQNYWKCTKFQIIDPKTTSGPLDDNAILISQNRIKNYSHSTKVGVNDITQTNYTSPEDVLCLYYAKELNKGKEIQKGNMIAYFSSNGFNQGADMASVKLFMPFMISGLNDYLQKIISQQITGSVGSFNRETADAINVDVSALREKTLLIIDNTIGYVNTDDLNKNSIKYLFLSRGDFQKSISDYENDKYCLFYRSEQLITIISIFDMKDKSLMYTCFNETKYTGKRNQFDKKDIKKMVSYYTKEK